MARQHPDNNSSSSSSSSASLGDLMDALRLRLILALWAGSLLLVLSALYDLPTAAAPQQQPHHNSLRGNSGFHSASTTAGTTATASSMAASSTNPLAPSQRQTRARRAWRPNLEEEARAIAMLSQPFQHLWSKNDDKREA